MRKLSLFLALAVLLTALPLSAGAVELEVAGKSALLMDAATGTVLYEKNAHEKLSPASVTKVMTLLLIMEAIDSGKIQWEDTVTASEAAAAKGGSQIYLKVGETMTVTDMVKSIAVSSANDCACAMAEHLAGSEEAFVGLMNEKARELGMNDTNFVNCTGLDDGPNADEHKTSAFDIALMSRELLTNHPDIKRFTTIWMDTVRNGEFGLSNTNKLIRFYSGATGLKTGFTSGAGYCLSATAEREGMALIAVGKASTMFSMTGTTFSTTAWNASTTFWVRFCISASALPRPAVKEPTAASSKPSEPEMVWVDSRAKLPAYCSVFSKKYFMAISAFSALDISFHAVS